MVNIIFKQANGNETVVNIAEGLSIMEGAIKNNIFGIEADCGGGCSCATCHIYIDEQFKDLTGSPSAAEEDMLDFAFDVRETSRLSCQIRVNATMENLVVHVPDKQM